MLNFTVKGVQSLFSYYLLVAEYDSHYYVLESIFTVCFLESETIH